MGQPVNERESIYWFKALEKSEVDDTGGVSLVQVSEG